MFSRVFPATKRKLFAASSTECLLLFERQFRLKLILDNKRGVITIPS